MGAKDSTEMRVIEIREDMEACPAGPERGEASDTAEAKGPRGRRNRALWRLLAGGLLLFAAVLTVCFLFTLKENGKREYFLFFRHNRAYVCLEGKESVPISIPLNMECPEMGVLQNEAGTMLLTLDGENGLFLLSITEEGFREGAQQIAGGVDDAYFWRDSVLYRQGAHLFLYDPVLKESRELLSDTAFFLVDDQEAGGFLVEKADGSMWCYDGEQDSFAKIADAAGEVKKYNADERCAYVLREGNLYIWQNGKEELLIPDCDGIEQIAEDGSLYFYREETEPILLKDCLADDLLEEDREGEPVKDGAYYRTLLENFRSAVWVDAERAADPLRSDWEGVYLSPFCEDRDELLFTPIHNSRMAEDAEAYITLEGNTASLLLGLGKGGRYRVSFTFENLEPGAENPKCTVQVETLREPDPGMERPAEVPAEGVYYNTSVREETDAQKRDRFREELQNSTVSFEYTKKVLYYFDGSESIKVADSFGSSSYLFEPETGLLFYWKEGMPYTLLSQLQPEEYSVDAFLKNMQVGGGSARESEGFGLAVKGKESQRFTSEAIGCKIDGPFGSIEINPAGDTLYYQQDSVLYAFRIEEEELGEPEVVQENVVLFFFGADGELYTVKSEGEEWDFYKGEQIIAENINGYSIQPVDEGEAFVFMDMEGSLYIYDGRSSRKISGNAVSWKALNPGYIAYIEREPGAQTGELYVYAGGESIRVETGVDRIFESSF